MAAINIDELSEVELIDLNHRIVERLRFLSQMRAHSQMLDFKIGERVTFHPEGYPPLVGIVARYNRKSLTVVTDAGQRWNIAPSLLRRADARERNLAADPKVVRLKKRLVHCCSLVAHRSLITSFPILTRAELCNR